MCEYKGEAYQYGSHWKDRCNTCFCSRGEAICTEMACTPGCYHVGIFYRNGTLFMLDDDTTCTCLGPFSEQPLYRIGCRTMPIPRPNPYCYFNGTYYRQKESFKIPGDCNHCVCMPRNLIVCSINDCDNMSTGCVRNGRVYGHLQRYYDDCNMCTCYRRYFFCTQITCLPA